MVTFGDLVMLLLTFFVMLLSMKSMDAGALKERFKDVAETIGPLDYHYAKTGGSLMEGVHLYKRSIMISSIQTLDEVFDLLEGIQREGAEKIGMDKIQQIIEVETDHRGVVIIMEFDHLFDSGKAEIRPDGFAILDGIGSLFRHVANDIVIMGHSDNQRLYRSEIKSNFELSIYRALSVLFYLTEALGLKAQRFAGGGCGALQPRYPNDTEANRSKNRRVEFILKKPA
jgi:chemotaxis protein MotB